MFEWWSKVLSVLQEQWEIVSHHNLLIANIFSAFQPSHAEQPRLLLQTGPYFSKFLEQVQRPFTVRVFEG